MDSDDRYREEAEALAQRLASSPQPARPIVVYGSSTVRLWPSPRRDLGRDDVVAVGFGGARLSDLIRHYDLLVAPLRPALLVVGAGANDLEKDAAGVDDIVARVCALIDRAHHHDATLPVRVLALKPAPYHRDRMGLMRTANQVLATRLGEIAGASLVDGFTPFLDADGFADPRYYARDQRHLNADGYALWSSILAGHLPAAPAG